MWASVCTLKLSLGTILGLCINLCTNVVRSSSNSNLSNNTNHCIVLVNTDYIIKIFTVCFGKALSQWHEQKLTGVSKLGVRVQVHTLKPDWTCGCQKRDIRRLQIGLQNTTLLGKVLWTVETKVALFGKNVLLLFTVYRKGTTYQHENIIPEGKYGEGSIMIWCIAASGQN